MLEMQKQRYPCAVLKLNSSGQRGIKKTKKKKKNLTNVEKEMYAISFSIIFE